MSPQLFNKIVGTIISGTKAFVFGGIGGISIIVSAGIPITSTKGILLALLGAFITGGLKAVEKYFGWQEPIIPNDVSNDIIPPNQAN